MKDALLIYKLTMTANYANFKGRATRREFWTVFLFMLVGNLIVALAGYFIGISPEFPVKIFLLFHIAPVMALSARRLHDTDRSGWWQFIGLVPILGRITYFVLMSLKGKNGPNRYDKGPVEISQ